MWIKSTWSFLPVPTGTTLRHDIMTLPFFLGSLPHLRPKPLSSPHMGGDSDVDLGRIEVLKSSMINHLAIGVPP